MNPIFRYFDLVSNLRPTTATNLRPKEVTDLRPTTAIDLEPTTATAPTQGEKLPMILPQYIALVLGVLIQPFFAAFQQTGVWDFTGAGGRLLAAVIIGIAILPGVYKNSIDPEKPILVQFCLLFVAGMGWESLLNTAISAVG